jgi:hypothetical protein
MRKMKSIKTNGMTQHDILFDAPTLYDALAFTQECLERAQIPFIVLGELALQLYLYQTDERFNEFEDKSLVARKVMVGTFQRYLTEKSYVSGLESSLDKFEKTPKGYFFTHNNVPCEIRIIKKKFKCLEDPDTRFFGWGTVNIPNPFSEYWHTRTFI